MNETSAKIANNYINDHKNWARTHFEMAEFYEKKGEISAAINELKTVTVIFPENPEPLAGIARIYKSAENWEKSRRILPKSDGYTAQQWNGALSVGDGKTADE
ncbi:MAG: tetratricopeptide repeat protein [Calditrichae bacterium]|nr:tetratricopeptide repeat protein [Calditrichia bacterium]